MPLLASHKVTAGPCLAWWRTVIPGHMLSFCAGPIIAKTGPDSISQAQIQMFSDKAGVGISFKRKQTMPKKKFKPC